jgi:hypothetical protein
MQSTIGRVFLGVQIMENYLYLKPHKKTHKWKILQQKYMWGKKENIARIELYFMQC